MVTGHWMLRDMLTEQTVSMSSSDTCPEWEQTNVLLDDSLKKGKLSWELKMVILREKLRL